MTTRPTRFGGVRRGLRVAFPIALLLPSACLEHPLKPVDYENVTVDGETVALTVNKNVDILFVIDNSGSMGEEQATLARNFDKFIEVLEEDDVRAHYRIGITTTDNGNPACNGTGPEGGKLVLSSCRSRTQDFISAGAEPVDATQPACLDICPEAWADIQTLPTTTERDEAAAPRPWIENIGGRTNLPEGLSTTQAFQCLGPQGINGCGFEEHLESMRLALTRATTDGEASDGFLRDDAILAVVFVTDEADCSANNDYPEVFSADGSRLFWSDPEAGAATSAVCWNAGVVCTGDPSGFDECHSVDLDVEGNPVEPERAEDDAVLHPLARYVDFLQEFEETKQEITPDQQVLVALIGGVGDDGEPHYAETITDPKFQTDFGIGPGCQTAAGRAVPPVRLAELSEQFQVGDQQNMYSICKDDYSEALRQIANAIVDQVKPACMPRCVADMDGTTDVLDPQCTLKQEVPQEDGSIEETTVPPCAEDGQMPSDDVDVCYVAKLDGALDAEGKVVNLTEDTLDDLSKDCSLAGWNLEFDLRRRDGFPAEPNTAVHATCQTSTQKAIDCPNL